MMEKYGRDVSGIEIAGTSSIVLRARVKNDLKVIGEIREFVKTMYDKSHFEKLKFDYIVLVFIYSTELNLEPNYNRIRKDNYDGRKCLSLGLELDVEIMRWCDKNDLDLMKEIFLIGTCEAVLHVLRKYKLPTEPVETLRAQYGDIPLTIEECETRSAQLKAEAVSS